MVDNFLNSRLATLIYIYATSVLIGPLIETALGQFIPIRIVRLFNSRIFFQILISAIIFAVLHKKEMWLPTMGVGMILAWAFIIRSRNSYKDAFIATFLIHGISNLITTTLQIAFRYLSDF